MTDRYLFLYLSDKLSQKDKILANRRRPPGLSRCFYLMQTITGSPNNLSSLKMAIKAGVTDLEPWDRLRAYHQSDLDVRFDFVIHRNSDELF